MTGRHRPRKRFGQHFLHDRNVINNIVAVIDPRPQDTILEIGPGQAALTVPLLEQLDSLHVIELDRDLARELEGMARQGGKLQVHSGDILATRLEDIVPVPVRVVGNLPYNVSTPLLFHLLQQLPLITDMVFMLQEEVVDRLCAGPGTKTYGRLSVMVQAMCCVEKLFDVPARAFAPQPRVNSAVARLTPYKQPRVTREEYPDFTRIVRESFNQRRKTLRNALKQLLSEELIERAGIDPGSRAEQLSIEQFACLARQLRQG